MQNSIRRAFFKFINTRIIGNNQRLYVDENDTETCEYDKEKLYLEDIGKFYYNDLTNVYEYFLYMKDDVDFEKNTDIKDCVDIIFRFERFAEVVKYFKYLFSKERLFYSNLSTFGKNIYENNFTPYSGELFYSEWFVKNMIEYAKSREIIFEKRKNMLIENDEELSEKDKRDLEKIKEISTDLENLKNEINIVTNMFLRNEI